MPRDKRAGFDTHWTRYGFGPRETLLLHCTLAHSGAWNGLSAHLGDIAHMTAFDLPSHGRSADWDPALGETQLFCAKMARDFIASQDPVDLIGHSFGATIALRMAVEYPDLVRSLVLCEPVFFAVARADDPVGQRQSEAEMGDFIAALEHQDFIAAGRSFVTYWDGPEAWDRLDDDKQARVAKQMAFVAAGEKTLYEDTAGLLQPGVLDQVTCPVLLIEGGTSPKAIRTINAGLAARLPKASQVIVAGAGHMVAITHPTAVAAEIKAFWRQYPA